ncbi:hypothetical protein HHK36_004747 [Tetracentron sinense]|uniref:DUF4219 domain-containing protein n=1 Tax=Tetracentron sinense TaxID=13715 RepID=A0A834ZK21_TETSI|nr:hypothetical protein HHK36_004747 [Tetracentron sinense]
MLLLKIVRQRSLAINAFSGTIPKELGSLQDLRLLIQNNHDPHDINHDTVISFLHLYSSSNPFVSGIQVVMNSVEHHVITDAMNGSPFSSLLDTAVLTAMFLIGGMKAPRLKGMKSQTYCKIDASGKYTNLGIEMLTQFNYKIWRICMELYLQGEELWDVPAGVVERNKWTVKSAKASFTLKKSIHRNVFEHTVSFRPAVVAVQPNGHVPRPLQNSSKDKLPGIVPSSARGSGGHSGVARGNEGHQGHLLTLGHASEGDGLRVNQSKGIKYKRKRQKRNLKRAARRRIQREWKRISSSEGDVQQPPESSNPLPPGEGSSSLMDIAHSATFERPVEAYGEGSRVELVGLAELAVGGTQSFPAASGGPQTFRALSSGPGSDLSPKPAEPTGFASPITRVPSSKGSEHYGLGHQSSSRNGDSPDPGSRVPAGRDGGDPQGQYIENSPGSVCSKGKQRLEASNLEDGSATSRVQKGVVEVDRLASAGGKGQCSEGGRSGKDRAVSLEAASPQDHLPGEVHSVISKQSDMNQQSARSGRSWPINGESSAPRGVFVEGSGEGVGVTSLSSSPEDDQCRSRIKPTLSWGSRDRLSPCEVVGGGIVSMQSGEGSNPALSSQRSSCFAEAAFGGCGKSPSSVDPTLSKTQTLMQPENPVKPLLYRTFKKHSWKIRRQQYQKRKILQVKNEDFEESEMKYFDAKVKSVLETRVEICNVASGSVFKVTIAYDGRVEGPVVNAGIVDGSSATWFSAYVPQRASSEIISGACGQEKQRKMANTEGDRSVIFDFIFSLTQMCKRLMFRMGRKANPGVSSSSQPPQQAVDVNSFFEALRGMTAAMLQQQQVISTTEIPQMWSYR